LEKIAKDLDNPENPSAARAREDARSSRLAIEARIVHRAGALKTAIDDAGAVYLPGRLHTVRIALKKLRYGVELSAEIAATKPGPALRTLKQAQDSLGQLHDVQVLIDRVRQLQAS